VLAGQESVAAVFVASLLLEIVRSFSNLYFPNTWQLALGAFLLLVILFRPGGIGSLWAGRRTLRGTLRAAVAMRERQA
jgi:branched-chain amino acid transport system permease protein